MPWSASDSFNSTQPDSFETHVHRVKEPGSESGTMCEKMKAIKMADDCYQIQKISHSYSSDSVLAERSKSATYPVTKTTLPGYFTFVQTIKKLFEYEQELLPAEFKATSDNHYAQYAKNAGVSLIDLSAGEIPEELQTLPEDESPLDDVPDINLQIRL